MKYRVTFFQDSWDTYEVTANSAEEAEEKLDEHLHEGAAGEDGEGVIFLKSDGGGGSFHVEEMEEEVKASVQCANCAYDRVNKVWSCLDTREVKNDAHVPCLVTDGRDCFVDPREL